MVRAMYVTLWLLVGLLAAWPLLRYARARSPRANTVILGRGLIVAALVYVVFAALWGDLGWAALELAGAGAYGMFYWLALRGSPAWLAAGWGLHPAWDGLLHLAGPGSAIAPEAYVLACISFDLAVAGYVLYRLREGAR
jgi:hypothetical protein